jgi:hypothetical protein
MDIGERRVNRGVDPHGFISRFQALPGDTSHLAAHKLVEF